MSSWSREFSKAVQRLNSNSGVVAGMWLAASRSATSAKIDRLHFRRLLSVIVGESVACDFEEPCTKQLAVAKFVKAFK